MPRYDFECKKCGIEYDELVPYDETGKYKTVKCPACKSKKKTKLVSCGGYAFSNPEGTDRWTNESTGHDYRFRHNLPKVLDQRAKAEAASHVGPTPYRNIDDISSGKHFGEVK